jgi:queuine tRNA-ribosyltransferase
VILLLWYAFDLCFVPCHLSLEVFPPVPTLVRQKHPLHSFLGFSVSQHMVSLSARDPADGREMPPNGITHVSVNNLRGVRKVCNHIVCSLDLLNVHR